MIISIKKLLFKTYFQYSINVYILTYNVTQVLKYITAEHRIATYIFNIWLYILISNVASEHYDINIKVFDIWKFWTHSSINVPNFRH